MKKQLVAIFVAIMVVFSLSLTTLAAEKGKTILEYNHDVTGDGKLDEILVYGIPFKDGSPYYKKIWTEIKTSTGKKLTIDYKGGGYEPKLDFADLNHDGVDDILYSSATGGSGGLYNYALHTVAGGKVKEIPLPEPLAIEGYFEQDFVAVIKIPGLKPIQLDLWNRRKDYIETGLYQKNGQLNEPTELMIDPIAFFEIVKIEGKDGYGLKGYRQISGAYHADQLGVVETDWYYEKGTWEPVHIEWKPSGDGSTSKNR